MFQRLLQKIMGSSSRPASTSQLSNTDTSPPFDIRLRSVLSGHTGSIFRIAWSPDGRWLASPSEDGTIRLWDTQTGTVRQIYEGHTAWVTSLAWSPDGATLVSGAGDQTVRFWNISTGQWFRTLRGYSDMIHAVAWSPDGRLVASVSGDNIIRIHEAATGTLLLSLSSWGTPVEPLADRDPRQQVYRVMRQPPSNQPSMGLPVISSLVWLPNGQLVWGTVNGTLQFWDMTTGKIQRTLEGQTNFVNSMAWTSDGRMLATSSTNKLIMVWNLATGQPMRILEGHVNVVTCVSFSFDGRLLASKSTDNTVRIWRCDTWETIKVLEEPIAYSSLSAFGGLAFHPSASILATLGNNETSIRIWDLNVDALLASTPPTTSVSYTNAKVILVGDSGVGKSGLSLVLTGQPFAPTASTHGRQVRLLERREVPLADGSEETREVLLWDLAGQPGDRLIHQLHLNEAAVALIVFDSQNERDSFAGVRYWDRALRQAQQLNNPTAPRLRTFLVAARVDRGIGVGRSQADAYARELGVDGYFETSAKEGWGIADLSKAIRAAIDWELLPRVSSTSLSRTMQLFLSTDRQPGRQVVTLDVLYHEFSATTNQLAHSDQLRAQFEACVALLETRGVLRRLNFGGLVLLKTELIDAYASSLLNAAKEDPEGLGSIKEIDALNGNFRMPEDERVLERHQEKFLLIATIEDLAHHQIAHREPTGDAVCLVFPSQLTREHPDLAEPVERTIAFRFDGPILTIYATLVVRLSFSGTFIKRDIWKNAVSYTTQAGGVYGVQLHERQEGCGELTLFFDSMAGEETRLLFEEFVHTHLQRRALANSIQRHRIFFCPQCMMQVPDEIVVRRRERGYDWVQCSVCEERISLLDREERLKSSQLSLVTGMDYAANAGRALETALSVLHGKISAGDADQRAWDILVAKCRRLHALEVQQAQFGISTPPHITMEIEDLRREVAGMEMHLQHGSRSVWVGHA